MKKIFMFVALCVATMFVSCGNKTTGATVNDSTVADTTDTVMVDTDTVLVDSIVK